METYGIIQIWIPAGEGLYTNMNAIRRDEELDNLHSCYVDQWDWEKVIKKEERTVETLESYRTQYLQDHQTYGT